MLNQKEFGIKLKKMRKTKRLTQKDVAVKISVSEQAVSKWENGECLPDIDNLLLLGKLFKISVEDLVASENDDTEKVVEIIRIRKASFEVLEKPETILAGKMIYAKDFENINDFHSAIDSVLEQEKDIYTMVVDEVLPIRDIHVSVNFWLEEEKRAFGFVRETTNELQTEGADVFKMPASLYIRAYNDKAAAELLAKEKCELWELFAYIRNFVMPAHGFKMAENGAQEMEVYDTDAHKWGYVYMPVMRI